MFPSHRPLPAAAGLLAALSLSACAQGVAPSTPSGVTGLSALRATAHAAPNTSCSPLNQAGPLVVAGFDVGRGGLESLNNSGVTQLTSAILSSFPYSTVSNFANSLAPWPFPSNVNAIILGVLYTEEQEIQPLSVREQRALKTWVETPASPAHVLILMTDNQINAEAANKSFLKSWKLKSAGTLGGTQVASYLPAPPADPIMQGPCGTSAELDDTVAGYFTKLGASTELASFNSNGKPTLAYLPGNGSTGTVVFFSDSNVMVDGLMTQSDETALLNALALY